MAWPDNPELEKTPTGDTSVNAPESGTYGEKAELARLRQSLPPMGPPGAGGTGAAPPASPPSSRPPQSGQGGIPAALLSPTDRPDVPLGQPLAPGGVQMPPRAQAADQQRLAILDALTTHPDVSQETREWAKLVRDSLIEGRR